MNRSVPSCLALIGLTCCAGIGRSQDEVPPPEQQQTGVIQLQVDGGGEGGPASLVIGQAIFSGQGPNGQSIQVMSAPMLNLPGAPDMMGMIGNAQIREELGLIDDQWKEVQKIQEEFSREVSEQTKSMMSGGFDPEKAKQMRELMQAARSRMKDRMNSVLLPHQQSRLDQLGYQVEMQNSSAGDALINGRLADVLELTAKQKERLKERAEELEKELEEKIKLLKEKARDELLRELTSKQRNKLDELIGDKFEYEKPDFNKQFRRARNQLRATEATEAGGGDQ